jgi:phosphoribosylaminoimidazole carboxylase/phosphoribosylaminoimidazole-succinocarboxamide synthase
VIYEVQDCPGNVLVQSKDRITANNALKSHEMEGKAKISNETTSLIFQFLKNVGM